MLDVRADGRDDAGGLDAETVRQRHRISAVAEVGIGKVETDRDVPQPDLARPGIADLYVLVTQYFGGAGLIEANCFRHLST